jgi:hypothetical protein
MIKPLKLRVRKSGESGVFHNSKQDVATLTKVCNQLIDKVNELTNKVNRLSETKK